jgi:uncharacterized membrane protein
MNMTEDGPARAFGWRVYGLGVIAIALVCLAFGDFDSGQPVPAWFPGRNVLAYATAAFLLAAGAGIEWRRTTAWAAAALTLYYTIIVVILMNGRVILAHPAEFGAYSTTAELLAIAAGGLIVYAAYADVDPARAARLTRAGQVAFGLCVLFFGGAHFVYMNLTAPLVPSWLPPSQIFWGYATGVAHIVAGIAILTGIQARLAAILLTIMYACFTPLVHLPLLLAASTDHFVWSENALNLALVGAAWVVADSLARQQRESG